MSMIGEYLRVTESELRRAVRDPQWALDFVEEVQDKEEELQPPPGEARYFSTYKTWDLLGFLLRRAGFPVDIVFGEESFAEDEDWGYGPPRYLSADRVCVAADALSRTAYDRLIAGVDPAELVKAEVYPLGWDGPQSVEWARDYYGQLTEFFAAAAARRDAMLVWLD